MATRAQLERAVQIGVADVGYTEGRCSSTVGNNTKYGIWYGMNCAAWCAMALSRWFWDAGFPLPASTAKGFAYTPSGAAWFKAKGAWSPPSANPDVGWVAFFYSASAGRIAHVAAVRGPRGVDGLIPTVEGNTDTAGSASGGRVLAKRRSPDQSLAFRIAGYGRPDLLDAPTEEWYMATPIPADNLAQIRSAADAALAGDAGEDLANHIIRRTVYALLVGDLRNWNNPDDPAATPEAKANWWWYPGARKRLAGLDAKLDAIAAALAVGQPVTIDQAAAQAIAAALANDPTFRHALADATAAELAQRLGANPPDPIA
jgi:hypothetical protein